MNKFLILVILTFCSCTSTPKEENIVIKKEKVIKQFGYTLNNYNVVRDTVKRGDSFGTILENNNLFYPQMDLVSLLRLKFFQFCLEAKPQLIDY